MAIRFELSKESQERFWKKVEIIPFHECWEWTAAKNEKGYGVFGVKKNTDKAHRIAWKLLGRTIPPGKFLCHHCDNPACVNPNHLFIGTNLDNVIDMIRKGRNSTPPYMAGHNRINVPTECLSQLGKKPDYLLGAEFGLCKSIIARARRERNVPSYAALTGNNGKYVVGMERHPRWG